MELPRYRSQVAPQRETLTPAAAGAGAAAMPQAVSRGLDVAAQLTSQIAQAEATSTAQAAISDLRIRAQEFLNRNEWENTEIDGRPTDEVVAEQWQEFQSGLEVPQIRDRRAAEQYDIARKEILSSAGIQVDNLRRKVLVDRTRANDLLASDNLLALGNYNASKTVKQNSLGLNEQEKVALIQRDAAIATDTFIQEDPYKALEELQKTAGDSTQPFVNDLDPNARNVSIRKAEAEIARREAEQRAKEAAARAAADANFGLIKDQISTITDAVKLGISVPPQNYSQIVGAAASLPDGPKKTLLMQDLAAVDSVLRSGFTTLPPQDQKAVYAATLGRVQSGEYDPATITALSIMKSIAESSAEAAKSDPMNFAIGKSIVPPIFPQEGEGPREFMSRVHAASLTVSQFLGKPAPGLTNEQIADLTTRYTRSNLDERTALLSTIVETHGRDSAVTLLEHIKKNSGEDMAIAGLLTLDGPAGVMAARTVVKGQMIRQEAGKAGKAYKPVEMDLPDMLNERLGNAYWERPEDRNLIEGAVRDAYLALAWDAGKLGADGVDAKLLDKAVQMVTGGIVEYNGLAMPAPVRGASQGQFDAFAESISPKDLEAVAGMTPDYAYQAFRRDGRLRQVSQGLFAIQVPGGPGGTYYDLKDKNGKPVTVEWRDAGFVGDWTDRIGWPAK